MFSFVSTGLSSDEARIAEKAQVDKFNLESNVDEDELDDDDDVGNGMAERNGASRKLKDFFVV